MSLQQRTADHGQISTSSTTATAQPRDVRRQAVVIASDARRCPMSLKLNHVHLKTRDPEKTAKFYVETLGAKIVGQAGNGGYRLDLHGLSLNVTNFIESQTREQKYGMEHIAIDTDELDNVVEKLKAQGINILEQTSISGGRRVCFFEGPDGVQLEFIEMKGQ
jgi:catechol 2,3-dioxygenase-like lactoylglutathione lyase family enzyme